MQKLLAFFLPEVHKFLGEEDELDGGEKVAFPTAITPDYNVVLGAEVLDLRLVPKRPEARQDDLLDVHGRRREGEQVGSAGSKRSSREEEEVRLLELLVGLVLLVLAMRAAVTPPRWLGLALAGLRLCVLGQRVRERCE